MTNKQLQNLRKKYLREGYKMALKEAAMIASDVSGSADLEEAVWDVYTELVSVALYDFLDFDWDDAGVAGGTPDEMLREIVMDWNSHADPEVIAKDIKDYLLGTVKPESLRAKYPETLGDLSREELKRVYHKALANLMDLFY